MIDKFNKASKILRREGPVSLAKATTDYVKWRFSPSTANDYQLSRVAGTEARWDLIENRLSPNDNSLIDIGCNVGELTAKSAQKGLFSIGLETNAESVKHARETHNTEGLLFANYTLSPDNIHKLPQTDIILFLSVYHYWYREYGPEEAEQMLEILGKKVTDKIFFEPPSRRERYKRSSDVDISPPPIENLDKESILDYNMNLLERTLGDEFQCEFVSGTPRGENREGERYLFVCERL